ncbi:hypothetical protein BCEP4_340028 [Burkholderia cepacia]|nr:hypothetical protein BCEP4_340028 [Burkholderia cepacia]
MLMFIGGSLVVFCRSLRLACGPAGPRLRYCRRKPGDGEDGKNHGSHVPRGRCSDRRPHAAPT